MAENFEKYSTRVRPLHYPETGESSSRVVCVPMGSSAFNSLIPNIRVRGNLNMKFGKLGPRVAVALSIALSLWMARHAAAIQITLDVVQSQSFVELNGDFGGTQANPFLPFVAQDDPIFPTAGTTDGDPTRPSNQTTLTGTITVDVDNLTAPTMIQILSADIDGTVNGNWLPEPQPPSGAPASSDPPDPATPADIGVKLIFFFSDGAYGAVRDVGYNVVTEIPDPDGGGPLTATPVVEPVNAQGEFSSYSQNISYRRGFFDIWISPFIDDARYREDLTGDDGLNQHTYDDNANTVTPIPNAPKSTYIVSGNLVTLTIPIEINNEDTTEVSQYFDGQFVATYTIPAGVPGDYNNNGKVDAADYVLWKSGGPLANEVDNPGTVNGADYTEWRARFGNPGSGAAQGDNAGVPEPASMMLLILGLVGLLGGYRQRQNG